MNNYNMASRLLLHSGILSLSALPFVAGDLYFAFVD